MGADEAVPACDQDFQVRFSRLSRLKIACYSWSAPETMILDKFFRLGTVWFIHSHPVRIVIASLSVGLSQPRPSCRVFHRLWRDSNSCNRYRDLAG
jgi:hypothetical protein